MCDRCRDTNENGPRFVFLPQPMGEVDFGFKIHRPLQAGSEAGALAEAKRRRGELGRGKVARIIGDNDLSEEPATS